MIPTARLPSSLQLLPPAHHRQRFNTPNPKASARKRLVRKHGRPQDHHRPLLRAHLPKNRRLPQCNETNPPSIQILAIGFLLVILSCALYPSKLPLLVAGTYVVAPLPNFICSKCAAPDDFLSGEGGSGGSVVDAGRFATGFLVVMGIGMFLSLSALVRSVWRG